MDPDEEEVNPDADNNANIEEDDAADTEDNMEEPDAIETIGEGGAGADENDDPDDPDDNEDNQASISAPPKSNYDSNDALGIATEDGNDTVKETDESPDPDDTGNEGGATEENIGMDENVADESKGDGGSGNDGNWQRGKDEEQNSESQNDAVDDIPNPFRSHGDA